MYFADGLSVRGAGKRYSGGLGIRRVLDRSVLEVRFTEKGKEAHWITPAIYDDFRRAHSAFVNALNTDMTVCPYPLMLIVNGHVTAVFRKLASAAALDWLDARGAVIEVAEIGGSDPFADLTVDPSCVHLVFKNKADALQFRLTFNQDTSEVAGIAA